MAGIIYVLTNEAMPGLVKIGHTTRQTVERRMAVLSSPSGVPFAFECHFAAKVNNVEQTEKKLHDLFSEQRVNPKREFFRVDPEKVVLALSIGECEVITPGPPAITREEQEALERTKKLCPIRLDLIGIKPGQVLFFSRDNAVKATVVENNKVKLDGGPLSLSKAAVEVLRSMGYKTKQANGAAYWVFDGELLTERRRRLEAERFDGKVPGG